MESEMTIYNNLHKLCKKQRFAKSTALAEYIHDNFDKMNDGEVRRIATKALSIDECKKILLEYELAFHNTPPKKYMSLSDFNIVATKIFNRYHWKAGGFLIEDNKWTCTVEDDKLTYVNTMCKIDTTCSENKTYLNNLLKKMRNVAENINVKLLVDHHKKNKLTYLTFVCKDATSTTRNEVTL